MGVKCAICGCIRNEQKEGVRFFGFPKENTELYKEWCMIIRITCCDKTFIPIKSDHVCNEHFIETDYNELG